MSIISELLPLFGSALLGIVFYTCLDRFFGARRFRRGIKRIDVDAILHLLTHRDNLVEFKYLLKTYAKNRKILEASNSIGPISEHMYKVIRDYRDTESTLLHLLFVVGVALQTKADGENKIDIH